MKKKVLKKKSFVLLIFVILIILVILTLVLRRAIFKQEEEKINDEVIAQNEELMKQITEEYFSDKICPQGMATLYGKYHGQNDLNDLYRGLYNLVGYIEKMYPTLKNYDSTQLEEYYNENPRKIIKTLGANSFEEFSAFLDYLDSVGYSSEYVYKYCKIDTETYEEDIDYLMFNLSFYYEEKDNLLNFKVYFGQDEKMKQELIFEPIRN